MRTFSLIIAVVLAVTLTACGYKTPLSLPKPKPAAPTPATAPAPAAPAAAGGATSAPDTTPPEPK